MREAARLTPGESRAKTPAVSTAQRERLTVKIPRDAIERLRDAVFHTPDLTVSSFVERCIRKGVADLESERGSAFPERTEELKPGRPRIRREET